MNSISLRDARRRLHWTQEDLEAKSGVDQSVISRLERGVVTRPEFDTVKRLAEALCIDPLALQFATHAGAQR